MTLTVTLDRAGLQSYWLLDPAPSYTLGLCVCLLSQHHSLHPEDGGSKVLQNIGILPHCHNPEDLNLKFKNI